MEMLLECLNQIKLLSCSNGVSIVLLLLPKGMEGLNPFRYRCCDTGAKVVLDPKMYFIIESYEVSKIVS